MNCEAQIKYKFKVLGFKVSKAEKKHYVRNWRNS